MQSRLLSDVAAAEYSDSELRPGNVLSRGCGEIGIQEPDALAPFHRASPQEKQRRIRDVLQWAHAIYKGGGVSLVESVQSAGEGSATVYYALVELRRVLLELDLSAWEKHPHRSRMDVHRLFLKAIGKLTAHRGGWRVSP